MLRQVRDDEDSSITQGVKVLIAITFISWCIYPIMWVLGAEGLNVIGLDFEVPSYAALLEPTLPFRAQRLGLRV